MIAELEAGETEAGARRFVDSGAAAAISSTRPPPGMSANARGSPHSSPASSTSKPASRTRPTVASKSAATIAG